MHITDFGMHNFQEDSRSLRGTIVSNQHLQFFANKRLGFARARELQVATRHNQL